MPKITVLPHEVICPEGLVIEDPPIGESICQILIDNNVNIEHACEMSCACTTCHIIIKFGYDYLTEILEDEEDLLDKAWGLSSFSRLSCQITMPENDLVIEIPKYTINHSRE